MTNSIVPLSAISNQSSPFDSIRHYDENGNEFWKARELMKLLGYKTWQKFSDAIDRAKSTCLLNEELESSHINFLPASVKSLGRPADDYRLSRKACLWVTMTGDTRKLEIAQAHQYFAVKIREAELVIPAQSERIQELKLELQLEQEKNKRIDRQDSMLQLHGREVVLALAGCAESIVRSEVTVTEVLDLATGRTQKFLNAEQLKAEVRKRTGQKLKTMSSFTESLREAGRDDLLIPVTRQSTNEYISPDRLDEAIGIVYGKKRQMLLGQ